MSTACDVRSACEVSGGGLAARVAGQVNSAIPGAEDPRTLAITVLNVAVAARYGTIELCPRLLDEAASYEIVDECGRRLPHAWTGDPGCAPAIVTLTRPDLPSLPSALAQVIAHRPADLDVLELSVCVSGKTVSLELTVGTGTAVDSADLGEAAMRAVDLAVRAACDRGRIVVHRALATRVVASVPAIPACGYRTFLLRPRTGTRKGKSGGMAMLGLVAAEPRDCAPDSSPQLGDDLRYHLGFCVEGVLPPAGPLFAMRPSGIVLEAFDDLEHGRQAVVSVRNHDGAARTAQIDWTLPASAVELIEAPGPCPRLLRAGEVISGLEAELPSSACLVARLTWA